MSEVDASRTLRRIVDRLAEVRARSEPPEAFGVGAHRFRLGVPLEEPVVAEFEKRHGVELPSAYRLFLTTVGDGGAGPGCGLRPLSEACFAHCVPGHLRRPSPYRLGPRYHGDWERRYEDPPGAGRIFLGGTLRVADHGCSLYTHLVVTGHARGRLFNLDDEGVVGPYVLEDEDFLSWYERWLDEVLAGFDVGWFGERLPLGEAALIETLDGDPCPDRRARAGTSLLMSPSVGEGARVALGAALVGDPDPLVRTRLFEMVRYRFAEGQAVADPEASRAAIIRYARSCVPLGLDSLAELGAITLDDLLPELTSTDPERRRRAAYYLAEVSRAREQTDERLRPLASGLLADPDPLIRVYAVQLVRRLDYSEAELDAMLGRAWDRETDPWVRYELDWHTPCPVTLDPDWSSASTERERNGLGWDEEPPF